MNLRLIKSKLKNNFATIAELQKVTKVFSNGETVIKDLDLNIQKSDFLTLLGKSGCGKTTILKILCGLLKPTKGKVVWPTSTFTNSEKNPANLSVVFQDSNLLPWLNVFENVLLPLKLSNIDLYESYERINDCLKLVRLTNYKKYFPNQLSGGMKMRVAIARALVTKPKVILMDEPFAALDEITRFRLNNDLLKIYRKYNLTIIFVTHSVYESAYLSNKIALISDKPASLHETILLSSNQDRDDDYRLSSEYLENCKKISEKLSKYNKLNSYE
tara:strand:- start:2575 stop:3393 length:819 start_codon:yes stop_codon:yes gene_type:complete